jgi:hypothetical protein
LADLSIPPKTNAANSLLGFVVSPTALMGCIVHALMGGWVGNQHRTEARIGGCRAAPSGFGPWPIRTGVSVHSDRAQGTHLRNLQTTRAGKNEFLHSSIRGSDNIRGISMVPIWTRW